jgi:general stress protein 26
MPAEKAMDEALKLVESSEIAMLTTVDGEGYPNTRAMIRMETEGLKTTWFSTNTSSRKIGHLAANPRACVYFVDFEKWMGLMLVGSTEILRDAESRKRLWRDGFEKYYPKGVDDPDYSVLRFTAHRGRYYHALAHTDLKL